MSLLIKPTKDTGVWLPFELPISYGAVIPPTLKMSTRRPRPSTSARSRQTTAATRQTLTGLTQSALLALQTTVESLAASRQPVNPKPPAGATPEKCQMEMSSSGFRTWRRSVETWLRIAGWPEPVAVLHIRLLCASALQSALDTRFTAEQWEALSPGAALDAIGKLVLRASNQAVRWCDFFGTCQAPGEPVSVYITRCAQEAMD